MPTILVDSHELSTRVGITVLPTRSGYVEIVAFDGRGHKTTISLTAQEADAVGLGAIKSAVVALAESARAPRTD